MLANRGLALLFLACLLTSRRLLMLDFLLAGDYSLLACFLVAGLLAGDNYFCLLSCLLMLASRRLLMLAYSFLSTKIKIDKN